MPGQGARGNDDHALLGKREQSRSGESKAPARRRRGVDSATPPTKTAATARGDMAYHNRAASQVHASIARQLAIDPARRRSAAARDGHSTPPRTPKLRNAGSAVLQRRFFVGIPKALILDCGLAGTASAS
jgi:hypothetical protein